MRATKIAGVVASLSTLAAAAHGSEVERAFAVMLLAFVGVMYFGRARA